MKSFGKKIVGPSTGARQTLYQAEDHLLMLEGYWTERYRKFPYRDITAIIWSPTYKYSGYNAGLGPGLVMAILLIVFNTGLYGPDGLAVFGWIIGVPMAVMLAVNLVKGPTVRCALRTKVQQVQLESVTRRARLNALLAAIGPQIEAAQGAPAMTYEVFKEYQDKHGADRAAVARAAAAAAAPPPLAGAPGGPPPLPVREAPTAAEPE